jgi:hypothetical protein
MDVLGALADDPRLVDEVVDAARPPAHRGEFDPAPATTPVSGWRIRSFVVTGRFRFPSLCDRA